MGADDADPMNLAVGDDGEATGGPADSPVLVVVLNDAADLGRVRQAGWYRIPLARAPRRIAADFLAFYQTAAFPPAERWSVRWLAPVRGYKIAPRRELIPDEPDHPRADQHYYKITLGGLTPLPRPVPSRRLRRITFIPTTLARLLQAEEINDLWIKSSAQERLWAALKQADLDAVAERQYPLREDLPQYVADFALSAPRAASPSSSPTSRGPKPNYATRPRPTTCWPPASGPSCASRWPSLRPTRPAGPHAWRTTSRCPEAILRLHPANCRGASLRMPPR